MYKIFYVFDRAGIPGEVLPFTDSLNGTQDDEYFTHGNYTSGLYADSPAGACEKGWGEPFLV